MDVGYYMPAQVYRLRKGLIFDSYSGEFFDFFMVLCE